jgi:hypothetical protein
MASAAWEHSARQECDREAEISRRQDCLDRVDSVLVRQTQQDWSAEAGVHHVEQCTRWDSQTGDFGVSNTCGNAVSVHFMAEGDERDLQWTILPGERVKTGLSEQNVRAGWWMFTACPEGYSSSIAFLPSNRDEVIGGRYRCRPPR